MCSHEIQRDQSVLRAEGRKSTTLAAVTLQDLPNEIVYNIALLLTPDAFVFLSQASSRFRRLFPLERYHLVQCLLALELRPEYGGLFIPVFDVIENIMVDPSYEDTASWDTIRFACASCLKLRHYHWFDSHALLRLRFRKPHLEARAATSMAEPGDARARATLQRMRHHDSGGIARLTNKSRRFWKQIYYVDTHGMGFGAEIDHLPESFLCGDRRHRRMCIECRPPPGTSPHRATIVTTLPQMCFGWRPHPHWPGYRWSELEDPPQSTEELIEYVCVARPRNIVTPRHRVRCPSCTQWKKVGDFGLSDHPISWLNHYCFELMQIQVLDHNFGDNKVHQECNDCLQSRVGSEAVERRRSWMFEKIVEHERRDLKCGVELYKARAIACASLLTEGLSGDIPPQNMQKLLHATQEYIEFWTAMEERTAALDKWVQLTSIPSTDSNTPMEPEPAPTEHI